MGGGGGGGRNCIESLDFLFFSEHKDSKVFDPQISPNPTFSSLFTEPFDLSTNGITYSQHNPSVRQFGGVGGSL